jgi:transposase
MAQKRMRMRKIREILRLHFECKLSNQKIANALNISKTSVFKCLKRFNKANLSWPLPKEMDDIELESSMYPTNKKPKENLPDFEKIKQDLSLPHTTLDLLWQEYKEICSDGLSRSSFYRHYKEYNKTLSVTMKSDFKGGDKLFVDYSGDSLKYYDRTQKQWITTQFFVCSWAASSYCYAEVSMSQNAQEWVYSHIRALNYFGCVPHAIVPDNLKSGVTKAIYYEPEINSLYEKFAQHYKTAVLPARVRKPRDKAVVESNVLHLQRFIFGRLRNRIFFSLSEINEAVWELLLIFNTNPMQQYKKSRQQRFSELDQPYAIALPEKSFVITNMKTDARVAPNYHVEFDKHFYSVPFTFAREQVDVYQVNHIIEIYHKGKHVCRHRKGPLNYGYTTLNDHMPNNHRFVKGWSSAWLIQQAEKIGPSTEQLAQNIIAGKRHPEQGFRAVMGVLNLGKKYSKERVEKASKRALLFNSISYRSVKSILEQGLEDEGCQPNNDHRAPVYHENIRGNQYYK